MVLRAGRGGYLDIRLGRGCGRGGVRLYNLSTARSVSLLSVWELL